MDERKYKTRDEWKLIINNISDSDFQNLVYELLNALGFTHVKQRGGGPDGGRDLEATYVYPRPNGDKQEVKCWLQCKKQNKGVSFEEIHTDIGTASSQRIDEYYILSNFDTTPDCKNRLESGKSSWLCRIVDWSGLKFQDILFSHPNICKYHFPGEEVPPVVDIKKPSAAIELSSEVGKRFGLKLVFNTSKKYNPENPSEVADIIKEGLLNLKNADMNVLALVYQKVCMFFFSIERTEDALMFLNKSLDITPKNIEALLNKGYILEKIDNLEESNKCYDEILEIDANNKFALNNKAHNLQRVGKYDNALKFIDEALEVDSNFIVAIMTKVEILKGLKKSKEAIVFLDEKDALVQKSIYLLNEKVDLYIDIFDLKNAYRINEEILTRDPNNVNAINNKGVIFEKNSKFQNREKYLSLAWDCFEKAVQKDDKYSVGWSNKIVVLLNSGQIDEAEKIIDVAYSIFPKDAYILNKKGAVLINKGKPREALKYLDKALKLWFKEEFLLNRAQAQLILNHWEEAKQDAVDLLNYNPEKSEAWEIKGKALKHLRRPGVKSCVENAEKFKEKPISLLE